MKRRACNHTQCYELHGEDEAAVIRMLEGRPPDLIHRADLQTAIEALARRGLNDREIAEHCGVTDRSVLRRRHHHTRAQAPELANA